VLFEERRLELARLADERRQKAAACRDEEHQQAVARVQALYQAVSALADRKTWLDTMLQSQLTSLGDTHLFDASPTATVAQEARALMVAASVSDMPALLTSLERVVATASSSSSSGHRAP
jgi:hypothetical protein